MTPPLPPSYGYEDGEEYGCMEGGGERDIM